MTAEPLGAPRDRRERKRYFTWRNVVKAMIVGVILFGVISVGSELRKTKSGEYGRLYSRRTLQTAPAARQPQIVIEERPVAEHGGVDPLLLESAQRAQFLGVTEAQLAAANAVSTPSSATSVAPLSPSVKLGDKKTAKQKSRFEITNGAGGVDLKVE